jgi:hypothetical protein
MTFSAELYSLPNFIKDRIQLFNIFMDKYKRDLEGFYPTFFGFKISSFIIQEREKLEITVTLPDGKNITGYSWKTTPQDIAISISKRFTIILLIVIRPLE